MNRVLPLAVTSGEPAGIGPDICLALADNPSPVSTPLVVLGDRLTFAARAAQLGVAFDWPDFVPGTSAPLSFLHIPTSVAVTPGQLDPKNAGHVLAMLDCALAGCQGDHPLFSAMVTAPVHKGVINDAGIAFTGHTEYLALHTGTPKVVMMLAGGGMRVALATTHLPLKAVSAAISSEGLQEVLHILNRALQTQFGIAQPRILVAGLNPHAGEGGHLGHEEQDVIEPVLAQLRQTGMQLIGPLPADTLFQPHYLQHADAVLAMYHDQGLPVLKYASFGQGINITLGLPIIRTSVDHGTALDLAGRGQAHAGSLFAAVALAADLAHRTALISRI